MSTTRTFLLLSFLFALSLAASTLQLSRKPRNYVSPVPGRTDVVKMQSFRRRSPVKFVGDNDDAPLSGGISKYGEYFASVTVGTPKQTFVVQVDTGSTALLIPDTTCSQCPSTDTKYNTTRSSTHSWVKCTDSNFRCESCKSGVCGAKNMYGDGSYVEARIAYDQVGMVDLAGSGVVGAVYGESDNFEPRGVDGIMGLANRLTNPAGFYSVFEAIQLAGQVSSNLFAMCLGKSSGQLMLGHVDANHVSGEIIYTDRLDAPYYSVLMNDVTVDDVSLGVDPSVYATNSGYSWTIVDSGTTLTVFPQTAFNALRRRFEDICYTRNLPGVCNVQPKQSLFDGNCYSLSSSDLAAFPTVHYELNGASLPVGPESYFITQTQDGVVYYCLGFAPFPDGGGTILGDTMMKPFTTVFDIGNKRVGFALKKNCD